MLHEIARFEDLRIDPAQFALASNRWRAEPSVPHSPRRVLPLALGAVAATMLLTGLASELFEQISGDRYAVEILSSVLR